MSVGGVVLYFPLSEPQGATTAGNIAPVRTEVLTATQVGTGGTLTFGGAAGCPIDAIDGRTAPAFTPVNTTNGLNLQTQLLEPITQPGDTWLEVACWFTAAASSVDTFLVNLSGTAGREDISLALCVSPAGVPFVRYSKSAGFATVANHAATNARNGSHHHFVAILNLVAPDMNVQVFYDGVNVGPVTGGNFLGIGSNFPNFSKLTVGGSLVNDLHTGTIAHVATFRQATTFPSGRFTQQYLAGSTGFAGERSDQRIRRYARYAGVPDAEMNI